MLVLKEVLRQKFVSIILSAESIEIVYILAGNRIIKVQIIDQIIIEHNWAMNSNYAFRYSNVTNNIVTLFIFQSKLYSVQL